MHSYLLSLDQGTTSSRSILFDSDGGILSTAQLELPQIYPQPGWVEHDPMTIWQSQLQTARQVLGQAKVAPQQVRAIGITNQRETTILWERSSGQPVCHAIVWQDRRSASICARWRSLGLDQLIRQHTGLVVDAYFSAPKLAWLFEHDPSLRYRAQRGELAFGTVDSWLLWQLTGGRVHATDVSNASRTMLWDIHHNRWCTPLLEALDIPAAILPSVHPSAHLFATTDSHLLGASIPIGGMAGDQQSALFGQACFNPGLAKNTYGTGCFLLMPVAPQHPGSTNGLVLTSAAQTNTQVQLALEGSVFIGGAVVQWLRDALGLIQYSHQVEDLASSVPDSGGVTFVPAFTGLGAPYWKPDARGALLGLSRGSTGAHIARAALESIAFQSAVLLQSMQIDAQQHGSPAPTELRVDGGAATNNLLLQIQADVLGIPVIRPHITETTALGAAYLAGLTCGIYRDTSAISAHWRLEKRFEPRISRAEAHHQLQRWEHAIQQVLT